MFLHSLDFPACTKVFLCCNISASRKVTTFMFVKRRGQLYFSQMFYFRRLKDTRLAAVSTRASAHVPGEVNLGGDFGRSKVEKT